MLESTHTLEIHLHILDYTEKKPYSMEVHWQESSTLKISWMASIDWKCHSKDHILRQRSGKWPIHLKCSA